MEGTMLHTITFPEMVDLVRKEFIYQNTMVKPAARQLFLYKGIGKGQGNSKRFDEVDIETYGRRKREAEKVKKASVGVGYNATVYKKRIGIEIDITQEMRDENRDEQVGTLITSLGHFCPQRIDLDGTHIFTFATASSYVDMDGDTVTTTVGDGNPLLYSAHELKFSDNTYRNRVAGDPVFSQGALELAEQLATTNILSNFGERRVMEFNTIVTSDDQNTVNAVKRVLQSFADVDGAHSGITNVNRNKYRHVILPNLATDANGVYDSTKRKWWFLGSFNRGMNGWQAYYAEWEAPHMKPTSTDENGANHDYSADVWSFGTRAGYGYRAVTGRGLIGSCPTSS
jgi:hypothetical protein